MERDLSIFLSPTFAYTLGFNSLNETAFDEEVIAAVKEAFPDEFAQGESAAREASVDASPGLDLG